MEAPAAESVERAGKSTISSYSFVRNAGVVLRHAIDSPTLSMSEFEEAIGLPPSNGINNTVNTKLTRFTSNGFAVKTAARFKEGFLPINKRAHWLARTIFFAAKEWRGYSLPAVTSILNVVTAIASGVLTDEGLDESSKSTLERVEYGILWWFTAEAIVEFLGSGEYDIDNVGEYRVAYREYFKDNWNIFDCLVVALGHIFASFRVVRLLRLLKLVSVNKNMQVLVAGLVEGGRFILAICTLLALLFYVFAVIGTDIYQDNDPVHFGSLDLSMMSLFRAATLEDWTDIMYINIYGCGEFFYPGSTVESRCVKDTNPDVAPIYFAALVFICNMIFMNLFIAVVTTSMVKAADKAALIIKNKNEILGQMSELNEEHLEVLKHIMETTVFEVKKGGSWSQKHHFAAMQLKVWLNGRVFRNCIGAVILSAAITSGMRTSSPRGTENTVLGIVEKVQVAGFAIEFVLKLISEGRKPWRYFTGNYKKWNIFNFLVLVMVLIPRFQSIARVFRCLSLTKLVTTIKTLNIVIEGLMVGMSNMFYVFLLIMLVFYIFAIGAINFFRDNDPWHFNDMKRAFLSLLRCASGDDWTDIMYINVYGCDKYPYEKDGYFHLTGMECAKPQRHGLLAAMFFISFMVVASLVLINLFVGVVTSGINEVMRKFEQEKLIDLKLKMVMTLLEIETSTIEIYELLFRISDADASGLMRVQELEVLLCPDLFNLDQLQQVGAVVDVDNSGLLDLSEFAFLIHCLYLSKQTQLGNQRDEIQKVQKIIANMDSGDEDLRHEVKKLQRISSSGRLVKTVRTMLAQKRVGNTAIFLSNEAAQRKAAVIMQDQEFKGAVQNYLDNISKVVNLLAYPSQQSLGKDPDPRRSTRMVADVWVTPARKASDLTQTPANMKDTRAFSVQSFDTDAFSAEREDEGEKTETTTTTSPSVTSERVTTEGASDQEPHARSDALSDYELRKGPPKEQRGSRDYVSHRPPFVLDTEMRSLSFVPGGLP